MLNFKYRKVRFCYLCFVLCALCLASGCATITDFPKGFLGISTKVLEDNRKDAIVKTFNQGYIACYDNVTATLKRMGAYVYAKNDLKKLIAVYVSRTDTTPVGIFFKEIDAANTQIEVSSPSKYGKETIANRIFNALEGKEEEPKDVSK